MNLFNNKLNIDSREPKKIQIKKILQERNGKKESFNSLETAQKISEISITILTIKNKSSQKKVHSDYRNRNEPSSRTQGADYEPNY